MASKSSWRLKFIDIDTSFSISTEPGTVKGYMVVRAPKGEVEPYYFDKGNQSAIEAYVGLGGSDYPDIEEAIAFNREYGIYISAPAGSSNEYPSYIGGKYITTNGLVDLYNVTSKENIDYMKMASPFEIGEGGKAQATFIPNTTLNSDVNAEAYAVVVSNISPSVWKDLKEVAYQVSGKTEYYVIGKDNKIFYKDSKGQIIDKKYCGTWEKNPENNTYTVVLGGENWLSNLAKNPTGLTTEHCFANLASLTSTAAGHVWSQGEGEETIELSNVGYDNSDEGEILSFTITNTKEGSPTEYKVKVPNSLLTGEGEKINDVEPETKVVIAYNFSKNGNQVSIKIGNDSFYTFMSGKNDQLTNSQDSNVKKIEKCLSSIVSLKKDSYSDNSPSDNIPFFNLKSLNEDLAAAFASKNITSSQIVEYFCGGFNYASWMTPAYEFSLSENDIKFKQYIKDTVLATIIQKSACEKNTKITLKDIGYDKWKYTAAAPLLLINPGDGETKSSDMDVLTIQGLSKAFAPGNLIFIADDSKVFADKEKTIIEEINNTGLRLYEIPETPEDSQSIAKGLIDVTEDYQTQDILINGVYRGTPKSPKAKENEDDKYTKQNCEAFNGRIAYIVDENTVAIEVDEADPNKNPKANYFLKPNINFGTITFSVAEGVYNEVDLTAGGTFTGSMNPEAVDSYGTNIYWPNVLNENDFSFVEVIPTEVDPFTNPALGIVDGGTGIYQGKRIIDDILVKDFEDNLLSDVEEFNIKGQRYISHLVDENKKQGIVGGAWKKEFEEVLKQGWIEALDANYDDVYIFMEPTGTESYKSMISSMLEGTHKLAIALSVKNLTAKEVEKPHTIKILARHKQHAQYAGRFLEYDSKTGRNYYVTPIGDIGKMCGRIFEKKMGGWAPAWYNYNSMGGQLDRTVIKAEHNFSDPATEIMDKKGLNPIIFNADDGLMVVSSKTTQDPNNETDWSFLEHVMSFCLLKREIRDKVMRPQIKKPIDDYWMQIRQEQVDAILDERISGPNKIWTAATCDIKGVNNNKTKAQRKFCILVKVKTTKFAEIVELTLETVAQNAAL